MNKLWKPLLAVIILVGLLMFFLFYMQTETSEQAAVIKKPVKKDTKQEIKPKKIVKIQVIPKASDDYTPENIGYYITHTLHTSKKLAHDDELSIAANQFFLVQLNCKKNPEFEKFLDEKKVPFFLLDNGYHMNFKSPKWLDVAIKDVCMLADDYFEDYVVYPVYKSRNMSFTDMRTLERITGIGWIIDSTIDINLSKPLSEIPQEELNKIFSYRHIDSRIGQYKSNPKKLRIQPFDQDRLFEVAIEISEKFDLVASAEVGMRLVNQSK